MEQLLNGKVALVTGAASGIGRSVAVIYAREGARVIVADVDEAGGAETVRLIEADGGVASFFKCDTADATQSKALVAAAISRYGALHVACNNAGIGGPLGPTGEYPLDGWQKVIDINLSGVFYGMRYQIPAMLASGGGVIVNMASILGAVGTGLSPAYVAAKHGVVGLTKAAALEYAKQGVRVNVVGPAYIKTPLLAVLDEATTNLITSLHPVGRMGQPGEVAELVAWLSSDRASFVTGSYYAVDGGYLAQ